MNALSDQSTEHVAHLSDLLSSGWNVVGYHVDADEAVNQHFILVQKDAQLRSIRFYEARYGKIGPTDIGYNGNEVTLAQPNEGY